MAKPNLSDIDQPTRFIEETYLAGITASRDGPCSSAAASLESDAYDAAAPVLLTKGKNMKYLVPSIVIPVLLFIGIAAHGILRPPIILGHSAAPAANSQAR